MVKRTHVINPLLSVVSSFVVPSAIDPDSREFGIQSYILEPDTNMFTLEVNTKMDGSTDVKVVLQGQLDREKQEVYQVLHMWFSLQIDALLSS